MTHQAAARLWFFWQSALPGQAADRRSGMRYLIVRRDRRAARCGSGRVTQGRPRAPRSRNRVTSDTTEGAVRRIMGKASNQKKKRRQGTGVSRADLESQRALEQLARAAQKLGGIFEARTEHLAAVSRYWWRGAEPEAAEVPDWAE